MSYRACAYKKGKFREFAVNFSDAEVISEFQVGGSDQMAMVGHAYFNSKFSQIIKTLLEREIDDFGVPAMFWEEFYAKHRKELTLYVKEFEDHEILEFDNIEELRQFDSEFLMNIDSHIISNICNVLKCTPNKIRDIHVIQAGLTNVSFVFSVDEIKYVYRHPGGNANNLIDRRTEIFVQNCAKDLGLDKSFIHMDLSGWKLSYYVEDSTICDFEKSPQQLTQAMKYLHMIHKVQPSDDVKVFDNVEEGKRLMALASPSKGNLFSEFSDIVDKVERLKILIEEEAKRLGYHRVLCHGDVYAPNFLATNSGEMYLIDWEYAGLNYEAHDILGIPTRYEMTEEKIDWYLKAYFGRDLSEDERRFFMAYIPIASFYWFCWGLYKGSVGDDDGFFFLTAYRNFYRYIDIALESLAK